ncbi:flavodoxin [Gordonibacter sp. 28C]|uniref:flavodoxin n=1 Tax=Gordonibacter sp. 28C TaxID=2078569 RepID=UPI0013142B60|nr:flavodoxin [Gordonibacter sp. 28C]
MAQMCYPFTGDTLHLWIGIAFAALAIAHIVLNRSWFAQLARGRWFVLRIVRAAAVFLGLAALVAVPASGILMSPIGLAALPEIAGMSTIRLIHLAGTYAAFVLFSLHLGLNIARLRKPSASGKTRPAVRIAACALVAIDAAYGAFAFGKHGIVDYLTLRSQFAFWDYNAPIALFAFDYASMMVLFAALGCTLGALASPRPSAADPSQQPAADRRIAVKRSRFGAGARLAAAGALIALSAAFIVGGRLATAREGQATWSSESSTWTSASAPVGSDTTQPDPQTVAVEAPRILVAYFTWADNAVIEDPSALDVDAVTTASVLPPGNVGLVARQVQDETNGDLYAIVAKEPYPSDYDACLERAIRESDAGTRPELTGTDIDVEEYDVVFLGFPNWWYSCPMAVLSFLEQHDFSGKSVIPFCVHGTGGLARSVQAIREAAPGAQVLDPLGISRETASSSEEAVDSWIASLDIS